MKTLNAALIIEKNQLYSEQPWIILFELQIDSTNYLRRVAFPERIIWNNLEWNPISAIIDNLAEEGGGKLGTLNIHVANVDRIVSAYVENNSLIGKTATIYIVHRDHLDETEDVQHFTFRVNRIRVNSQVATFELGHDDLFALQLPRQRYLRDKCSFIFRDEHCGYPNDEFGNVSNQDFLAGGDGDKGCGWVTANSSGGYYEEPTAAARTSYCKISDGRLRLVAKAGPYYWEDATRTGIFVYKTFMGDFDINTYYTGAPDEESDSGGAFLMQDSATANDWLCLESYAGESTAQMRARYTLSNATSTVWSGSLERYWRIVRSGGVFTFYGKVNAGDAWEQLCVVTQVIWGTWMRVGYMAYTKSTSSGAEQSWDYFRVDSGGYATCDYTLDGPNGCRNRKNNLRFGGDPSIPFGRLYGI